MNNEIDFAEKIIEAKEEIDGLASQCQIAGELIHPDRLSAWDELVRMAESILVPLSKKETKNE